MSAPHPFRPEPASFPAGAGIRLDGQTARAVPVLLYLSSVHADLLALPQSAADAGTTEGLTRWPLSALRRLPDQAAGLAIRSETDPAARILTDDGSAIGWILARAGRLDRRAKFTAWRRLAGYSASAAGSVAVILLLLLPLLADQLATILPPEAEAALGEATLGHIRTAFGSETLPVKQCGGWVGAPAMQALHERLTEGLDLPMLKMPIVLAVDEPNAFALPGGIVVVFKGLIDLAETPEELAAVLTHEYGHVAGRDPVRVALGSAGSIGVLGLLFGDFAGGTVVLLLANRIVNATHSREAEAAADSFARKRLQEVGIPPSALADIFARMQAVSGEDTGLVRHLSSHPALGDRIAAARAAKQPEPGEPLLTPLQWQALKRICSL